MVGVGPQTPSALGSRLFRGLTAHACRWGQMCSHLARAWLLTRRRAAFLPKAEGVCGTQRF